MEAILACHPALSTEWPGWVAILCEPWRIRTSAVSLSLLLPWHSPSRQATSRLSPGSRPRQNALSRWKVRKRKRLDDERKEQKPWQKDSRLRLSHRTRAPKPISVLCVRGCVWARTQLAKHWSSHRVSCSNTFANKSKPKRIKVNVPSLGLFSSGFEVKAFLCGPAFFSGCVYLVWSWHVLHRKQSEYDSHDHQAQPVKLGKARQKRKEKILRQVTE